MQNIENTEQKRIVWVDLARVICLFIICVAHSSAYQLPGTCLVISSVTLFFFLAGFFNSSSFRRVAIRSAKLLVVSLIWFLVFAAFDYYSGKVEGSFFSHLVSLVVFKPRALWFIEYLVIALPFSYLVNKLPVTFTVVICIFLTSLWAQWNELPLFGFQLITRAHPHPDWLPFSVMLVLLGGICRRVTHSLEEIYPSGILNTPPKVGILACILLIAVVRIFDASFTCYMDMYSILGAFVLLAMSNFISNFIVRPAEYLASLAPALILVYMSHGLIIRIFITFYLRLFSSPPPHWIMCAFCAVLMVASACLFSWSRKKRLMMFLLFAR